MVIFQKVSEKNVKKNLDSYALPKSLGMFMATERTDGISTSDMITRIVKVNLLTRISHFEKKVTSKMREMIDFEVADFSK